MYYTDTAGIDSYLSGPLSLQTHRLPLCLPPRSGKDDSDPTAASHTGPTVGSQVAGGSSIWISVPSSELGLRCPKLCSLLVVQPHTRSANRKRIGPTHGGDVTRPGFTPEWCCVQRFRASEAMSQILAVSAPSVQCLHAVQLGPKSLWKAKCFR